MKGKVAIISPSKNAYSETFIQAHRNLNQEETVFVYGGLGDLKVDTQGPILSKFQKVLYRIFGRIIREEKYDIEVSLRKIFRKNSVKSVLIEYGNFGADILPFLKFFKGKIVVHFHGYDASVYKVLELYKEKYVLMSQKVERIVAVSEVMKKQLESLGIGSSKILLNHYGPNPLFFEVTPDHESKNLLYVGRFVPKKTPYYLVLVMNEVVKSHPEAVLRMIGDGPLIEVVRNMVRYFGLERNVLLEGRKSPEEIVEYMNMSSIFIQHSVTALDGDSEGTPLTILESCAASMVVVSTYHAGIQDVVKDGETGFLVEEHDINEMEKVINNILLDPAKRKEVGAAARRRISESFSLRRSLSELNKLLLD